jgi:hypothetical protein
MDLRFTDKGGFDKSQKHSLSKIVALRVLEILNLACGATTKRGSTLLATREVYDSIEGYQPTLLLKISNFILIGSTASVVDQCHD